MFTAIATLIGTVITGITSTLKGKQKIKAAVIERRAELAASAQEQNAAWELRALENAGWKDELLFLSIIGVYVYSAIDPEGAQQMFANWEKIPEWFRTVTLWTVASIVGVKKLADYAPPLVKGVKEALKWGK